MDRRVQFHGYPLKSVIRNMLLAAVAILLMALVLEFVLRATHFAGARRAWTQPDDLLGWRSTPGRGYWSFRENDHAIEGRINRFGWRDAERTLAKPAGTYRVAVLGDSYVEAMEVERDSTFCAIVEREFLRRSGTRVEVLSFGRAGMATTEELLVLERDVFDYVPDLVVLLFVPLNDIADMSPVTTINPMRPFYRMLPDSSLELDTRFTHTPGFRTRKRINWIKQRSALVSLLAERYNVARRVNRLRPHASVETRLAGYLSLCTQAPDSVYASNYALNKRLIIEAGRLCRQRDTRLLLVAAQNVYISDEIDTYRRVDDTFDPGFFDDDLNSLCEREEIPFLGLQEVFRRHYDRDGVALTWAHYSYAGHRLVAAEVGASITRIRDSAQTR